MHKHGPDLSWTWQCICSSMRQEGGMWMFHFRNANTTVTLPDLLLLPDPLSLRWFIGHGTRTLCRAFFLVKVLGISQTKIRYSTSAMCKLFHSWYGWLVKSDCYGLNCVPPQIHMLKPSLPTWCYLEMRSLGGH